MRCDKRAQSERSEKTLLDRSQDRLPAAGLKNRMIQRDGQQLIWPAGGIVALRAIDDVVKITLRRAPKFFIERVFSFVGPSAYVARLLLIVFFRDPFLQKPKGVVPECIDFNGLAATRSDNPIANFRIHPRQLVSFFALTQQRVVGIDPDAEQSSTDVRLEYLNEFREEESKSPAVAGGLNIAFDRVKEP